MTKTNVGNRVRVKAAGCVQAVGGDRGAWLAACLAVLAISCLLLLPGCKDTNAIKNIVHDQNAEKIDYESGETYRVVSDDGRLIAEDTGVYKIGGDDVESLPVNLVYVSKDPETELPTSRFVYDENSTNHSEATEGVSIVEPEPEPEPEPEQDRREPESQPEAEAKERPNDDERSEKPSKGSSPSGPKDEEGEEDGQEDPPDDDEDDEPEEPSGAEPSGAGEENEKPQVYDATGKEPEVPDAAKVAAYGQIAVIVQMLGGTDADGGSTPLAAADDELCAGAFPRVFADEGSAQINGGAFLADGSGGYVADIDQIIEAGPDTVLAFSDAMFTEDEQAMLGKHGISITVVPALTSDTGIMRAVEVVAAMLDKSTDGLSTSRCEMYRAYHDALIADVEGVRGYGAYGGVVYDANMASRPPTFEAQKFTLVIDEWDFGATYGYGSAISDAGAGIGLSTVGFRNSPVSYYLGVAGVVNNAAAIDETKRGSGLLAPAWQFNPSDLDPSQARYSSDAYASRLYTNWGTGLTKVTLSKVDTKKNTLRDNGLGTDAFPVVIVASARMRDSFLKSANAPDGIYHPFGYATSDLGEFAGTMAGKTQVYTVIDENLDTSPDTAAVAVNPHGLFSSWLEGSVESVLECAWAASIPSFDSDWGGSAAGEVAEFYHTFYRYDELGDGEIAAILEGLSG